MVIKNYITKINNYEKNYYNILKRYKTEKQDFNEKLENQNNSIAEYKNKEIVHSESIENLKEEK